MKTLKIKQLKSVVIVFALLIIGSFAIASNGKDEEKTSKQEVKVETKEMFVNKTWYYTASFSNDPTDSRNYSSDPEDAQSCELPFQTICQIEAPESPTEEGQPHMGAPIDGVTVLDQITEALGSLSGPNANPTLNSTVTGFKAE